VYVRAHVEVDNSFPWTNQDYTKQFFVDFPLSVDSGGALHIGDGLTRDEGVDATTQLYVESVEPAKGEGYVQATVRIVSSTAHGRTGGVGYEVNQSVSGRSWTKVFRLNVARPAVEPEVTIGPISVQRRHRAHFERPRQDQLTPTQLDGVVGWYRGLSEETRRRIQEGQEPVVLVGRASTTGTTAQNLELANARMLAVRRAIEMYAGNRVQFHTSAEGEYGAGTEDNIEAREERRVDLSVWQRIDE
jgi:hypothetical protein